ncbi:MAG: DUF6970 domain-containing protein [Flavisolibacter sp.]
MKSILFTLTIFLAIAANKCQKKNLPDIPACIEAKIEAIKKEPKWNPAAEVKEFTYAGMRVFYFSSNCCDQYNTVVDENCNVVCAPSGGMTGKGDGGCNDFLEIAKEVRVVWKDMR